jgi:hypothetical protein
MGERPISLLHDIGMATDRFRLIRPPLAGFDAVAFSGAVNFYSLFPFFRQHTVNFLVAVKT